MFTPILLLTLAAPFGLLEGHVRDARTHNAIPLARVELLYAQTPVDLQYANMEGGFHFTLTGAGRYTLSAEYSGYERSVVEVDAAVTALPVSIELQPKKVRFKEAETVVSIREYTIPAKARHEFDLARQHARKQEYMKAVDHFEKGLRIFEAIASVHNDLGNCYRKLEHLDSAEREFKRARTLSDSVYVVLNLAEVYTAQGRFSAAERLMLDTIHDKPNAGDAYYGLALIYLAQKRIEEARQAAIEADKRPHQIPDVHLVLAEIYQMRQEPDAAAEQQRMYIREQGNKGTRELIPSIN
jgi:Tfp pilus assembly protein PilF